jgi:hypothetical protein
LILAGNAVAVLSALVPPGQAFTILAVTHSLFAVAFSFSASMLFPACEGLLLAISALEAVAVLATDLA